MFRRKTSVFLRSVTRWQCDVSLSADLTEACQIWQGGHASCLQVCDSMNAPSSRFVVLLARFLISVASIIQHWCLLLSVWMTLALSQSIMGFSLFQWSVMADSAFSCNVFSCLCLSFVRFLFTLLLMFFSPCVKTSTCFTDVGFIAGVAQDFIYYVVFFRLL